MNGETQERKNLLLECVDNERLRLICLHSGRLL